MFWCTTLGNVGLNSAFLSLSLLIFSFCQSRPEVDEHIAVLHELNTALTMASGHPSQNRVGGVIQALVPLLAVSNNEVGVFLGRGAMAKMSVDGTFNP